MKPKEQSRGTDKNSITMTEKEQKKMATLVKRVAESDMFMSIFKAEVVFSESEIKFVKEHEKEFIDELNCEPRILGRVQYPDKMVKELEEGVGIWFEN